MRTMRQWIRLVEGRWYDDTDTVTVYHGTSSALLPDIQEHGVHPPADPVEYALRVLYSYIPEPKVTPKLRAKVIDRIRQFRDKGKRDMHGQEMGSAIYGVLIGHKKSAIGYAKSYTAHGGELAYDVWSTLKYLRRREFTPRFKDAYPVVLTLEVPKSWIHTYQPLADLKQRLLKRWDDRTFGTEEYDNFQAYMDDHTEFEVRIDRVVPPEMIMAAERV